MCSLGHRRAANPQNIERRDICYLETSGIRKGQRDSGANGAACLHGEAVIGDFDTTQERDVQRRTCGRRESQAGRPEVVQYDEPCTTYSGMGWTDGVGAFVVKSEHVFRSAAADFLSFDMLLGMAGGM